MQVDVTSKTEGKAFADAKGVPLLVKYDTRLRQQQARDVTEDVSEAVGVQPSPAMMPLKSRAVHIYTIYIILSSQLS